MYGCDVGKERGEQGFNCAYLDMDRIKECGIERLF